VPHGAGLILGVHHDPVPAVEKDRSVVQVADSAANVHAGVPTHRDPVPALGPWLLLEEALIRPLGHAGRITGAEVDRFSTGPVATSVSELVFLPLHGRRVKRLTSSDAVERTPT